MYLNSNIMACNSNIQAHFQSLSMAYFLIMSSIFIFFIPILILHKLHFKTSKLPPPPGPRKLPFIGNLHLLAFSSNHPHQTLTKLSKKHGPLMHLKLGEIETIVVSSPESAKQVLKTHDVAFASRPSLLVTEISCYGNTDIAFAPYGEYWRQLRKICTLELLSAKRVGSFRAVRENEFSDLCRWIARAQGSVVSLTEKVSVVTYNIMAIAAMGKKSSEQTRFIEIVKETIEFLSVFRLVDVYPSARFMATISGVRGKIEKLHAASDRIMDNIIRERRRVNAAKIDDDDRKEEDLLDVLLKIQDSGSLQVPLTTDNIKAILAEIFGAGIESSTSTVDWAMAEMLKNPTVLNKAQDEVRRLFDSRGNRVEESLFDELSYLKLVIKETLRLHPPTPLLLPRECRESCEIDGYEIPKKARILVNAWAIGRDSRYWEDGERFNPERFLEKRVDYKDNNSFEYIPFGGGRRICPGISFGLANIELPLAMFLYHFDWILPDGMKPEDMDMEEAPGVAPRRKKSLAVIPILKRPVANQVK